MRDFPQLLVRLVPGVRLSHGRLGCNFLMGGRPHLLTVPITINRVVLS